MPYRPEGELKRPDLKGAFHCGHCGKTFCHAASLNRHRLNFHGDDQTCLLCNTAIQPNETVRRHMLEIHGLERVFTCGCCNWTFPDKKELHSHNVHMLKYNTPGDARVIAISSRPPGSLSQHEIRGEERAPRNKKRTQRASTGSCAAAAAAAQEAPADGQNNGVDHMMQVLQNMLAVNALAAAAAAAAAANNADAEDVPQPIVQPVEPPVEEPVVEPIVEPVIQPIVPSLAPPMIPATWLNNLIATNPSLLPLLQLATSAAVAAPSMVSPSEPEVAESNRPSTSSSSTSSSSLLSAMIMNNNVGETSATVQPAATSSTAAAATNDDSHVSSGTEEEEVDIVDTKDILVKAVGTEFLSVRTEQPLSSSMSSGPESGIGSAPISNTPSPVSSSHGDNRSAKSPEREEADKLLQDFLQRAKMNNKRRSLDVICSQLSKQARLESP